MSPYVNVYFSKLIMSFFSCFCFVLTFSFTWIYLDWFSSNSLKSTKSINIKETLPSHRKSRLQSGKLSWDLERGTKSIFNGRRVLHKARKGPDYRFVNIHRAERQDNYSTFQFPSVEDKYNIDNIMEQFDAYCQPRKNLTILRHKFLTSK